MSTRATELFPPLSHVRPMSEQRWFYLSPQLTDVRPKSKNRNNNSKDFTPSPRSAGSKSPPDTSHVRITSPYLEHTTIRRHRQREVDGIVSPEESSLDDISTSAEGDVSNEDEFYSEYTTNRDTSRSLYTPDSMPRSQLSPVPQFRINVRTPSPSPRSGGDFRIGNTTSPINQCLGESDKESGTVGLWNDRVIIPKLNLSPSPSPRDKEVMRRMGIGVTPPPYASISECRYGSPRLQDESAQQSPYIAIECRDVPTKITRLGRVGILDTVEENLESNLSLDSSLSYISSHGSTVSLPEKFRKKDVIEPNAKPTDQQIGSRNDGTKTTTRSGGKKKHKKTKCKGKQKEEEAEKQTLPPLKGVPRQPTSDHSQHAAGSCVVVADTFNRYALSVSDEWLASMHEDKRPPSRQVSGIYISRENNGRPNRDNAALTNSLRPSTSRPREVQTYSDPRRSSSNHQFAGASSVPTLPPIRSASVNRQPKSTLAQLGNSPFLPTPPTSQRGKPRPSRHAKGASKSGRKP